VTRWVWVGLSLVATIAACKVGDGDGWLEATLWAPQCDMDGDAYELRPTFFASEPQPGDVLVVRVQRGSDSPEASDGLILQVLGASVVHEALLGVPIDLAEGTDGARVIMTLYLNETCPVELIRPTRPVVYTAAEGTIVFDAIYAPEADDSGTEIAARFEDVLMVDTHDPDALRAVASGELSLLHVRGRPAQPFP
jgi:hypothetical protein